MVQEVDGMENAEIAANVSRLHCDWRLAVLPSGIAKWHCQVAWEFKRGWHHESLYGKKKPSVYKG